MRSKFIPLQNARKFFCVICLCVISTLSFAQQMDVVDAGNASSRKEGFHNRFGGVGKPTTRAISFSVTQLQAILDEYKAAGVSQVVFVPAMIRGGDDVNRYAARHPELSAADRAQIANRSTLLIKAPQNGAASLKNYFEGIKYYDIGNICPPPFGSCIE